MMLQLSKQSFKEWYEGGSFDVHHYEGEMSRLLKRSESSIPTNNIVSYIKINRILWCALKTIENPDLSDLAENYFSMIGDLRDLLGDKSQIAYTDTRLNNLYLELEYFDDEQISIVKDFLTLPDLTYEEVRFCRLSNPSVVREKGEEI